MLACKGARMKWKKRTEKSVKLVLRVQFKFSLSTALLASRAEFCKNKNYVYVCVCVEHLGGKVCERESGVRMCFHPFKVPVVFCLRPSARRKQRLLLGEEEGFIYSSIMLGEKLSLWREYFFFQAICLKVAPCLRSVFDFFSCFFNVLPVVFLFCFVFKQPLTSFSVSDCV